MDRDIWLDSVEIRDMNDVLRKYDELIADHEAIDKDPAFGQFLAGEVSQIYYSNNDQAMRLWNALNAGFYIGYVTGCREALKR